jgi:hypothetical protein
MAPAPSQTALAPKRTVARVSRAVERPVDPGNDATCNHCSERVKFAARAHNRQVIANVYDDGKWQRVEHYHADCYGDAGQPWGAASA